MVRVDFNKRRAWPQMVAINGVNKDRARLAQARGWQFAEEAPALLDRWPVLPFTQRGDMRLIYGVLSGVNDGLPFTVLDFIHRHTVINKQALGITVNQHDKFATHSVWVIHLPTPMPFLQLAHTDSVYYDVDDHPRPTTHDRKFTKRHRLVDTDPTVAARVLTPPVVDTARDLDLKSWSLIGSDLVYAERTFLGTTRQQQVLERLAKLAHFAQRLTAGLAPPPPQQAYPPAPHQAYPPAPQQGYPPAPQPGYPPPPGQYGPPPGYPPQPYPQHPQPYPQPGYPPQYPPPGYPPRG